jgi:hypothetical protein
MSNTSDIKLTFFNDSNDQNNSNVVIFQKNVATDFDEIAVAWKVIQNCGTGWQNSFVFPMAFQVGASDSWGNTISNPLNAENGQMFHVYRSSSGDSLAYCGQSASRKEVQLRNDLPQGSIDASIYKDGRLLALKTGISPQQKAVFQFNPTLWIGVVSDVEQGEVMNSAIISDVNTELGLLGVASANIIMTGGGVGPYAQPFTFTLDNVVYY